MRHTYLIVASLNDNRVYYVAESPPITAFNYLGVAKTARNWWNQNAGMYRAQDCDIMTGTATNFVGIQEALPNLNGWPATPQPFPTFGNLIP